MKIKLNELKQIIREILKEESDYQEFFKATMEKFGVKSPAELKGDKKKEFFDFVDKNWHGKKETPTEKGTAEENVRETLEPVSPASGNPLKRVKAKKRDQILAQEEAVRKIVKEELTFLMFSDTDGSAGHKVQKRRKRMDVSV